MPTGRGGVGKTTATAHPGAQPDPGPLLVDPDSQPGAAGVFGRDAHPGGYETVLLDPPPSTRGPLDPADPFRPGA